MLRLKNIYTKITIELLENISNTILRTTLARKPVSARGTLRLQNALRNQNIQLFVY